MIQQRRPSATLRTGAFISLLMGMPTGYHPFGGVRDRARFVPGTLLFFFLFALGALDDLLGVAGGHFLIALKAHRKGAARLGH